MRTTIFSWNCGHTLKRIPHCYMLSLALLWCRNSMATLNRGWSCLQTHFTLYNLSSTKGSLAYSTDWLPTTHLALLSFAYYLSSLFCTVLFRKVRFPCRKFLFSILMHSRLTRHTPLIEWNLLFNSSVCHVHVRVTSIARASQDTKNKRRTLIEPTVRDRSMICHFPGENHWKIWLDDNLRTVRRSSGYVTSGVVE